MKKKWIIPMININRELTPGDDTVIGEGSGQSGFDLFPMSFEMWNVMCQDIPEIFDYNNNGIEGEWEDYVAWMTANGWEEDISE